MSTYTVQNQNASLHETMMAVQVLQVRVTELITAVLNAKTVIAAMQHDIEDLQARVTALGG